jgi:hypothetical protein
MFHPKIQEGELIDQICNEVDSGDGVLRIYM